MYLYSGKSWLYRKVCGYVIPVTIVYFHDVRDKDAQQFRDIIQYLEKRCELVDLAVAVKAIREKTTKRLLTLTFDDGYCCLIKNVFPVVREKCIPITVFISSGLMGRIPYPIFEVNQEMREQMRVMTVEEIQKHQDDLISFQSHTLMHKDLYSLSREELEYEYSEDKRKLEDVLGRPIWAVCYPHGDCNSLIQETASKYFDVGLSSFWGINQRQDMMALNRVNLSDIPEIEEVKRRLSGSREWCNFHLRRRAANR